MIPAQEAATLVAVQEAGLVERTVTIPPSTMGGTAIKEFSVLQLLNFNRHPREFELCLQTSELLREVREALHLEGLAWRHLNGLKTFVSPHEYTAARRAIVGLRLGPTHVVASGHLEDLVLATVGGLPKRFNVRLRESKALAYLQNDGEELIVRGTFLCVGAPLLGSRSVVNSTTAARQGRNPRRRSFS